MQQYSTSVAMVRVVTILQLAVKRNVKQLTDGLSVPFMLLFSTVASLFVPVGSRLTVGDAQR